MIYFALRRKIEDMKDRLNKTDFLRFLSCPNEFWLKLRMPLLFPQPATMEYQHLREQGYAVERYVKKLEQFQSDEKSTVDFRRAGIMAPAARIKEMNDKLGYYIPTVALRDLWDDEGYCHPRVAVYELIDRPKNQRAAT